MRRIAALLLALCLTCSLALLPAGAAGTEDAALQTVRALGIMKGDENGNMNLSRSVTRAEFATMLVQASAYQDTVSQDGSGYSLFKDVKSDHWASEYIRVAVRQGWMTGYTDGSFKPDKTITLEEACAATLNLLGYQAADLGGSFPYAQLNKAQALGMRDQIGLSRGGVMSRQNCVNLFYNLLTASTPQGQTYATTLGYTVKNGQVDYTSVTYDNLSGPHVADSGQTLPFVPTTIYRNGERSASAALSQYDVYYYNEGLGAVWIYTDRVSGKIGAVSPSSTAPTAVTVSGVSYSIGSALATYKISVLGGGNTGSVVTLLLGMDDAVVDVVTGDAVEDTYYGVIVSSARTTDDAARVQTQVTMVCADGVERTFTIDKSATFTAGRLAKANITAGEVTVTTLSEKSISGKVSSDGTKLGTYPLADGVDILDTSSQGDTASIHPSRLAGYTLSGSDVRYYALDASGAVETLILDDATGDTWTYGYMTAASTTDSGTSTTGSYTYLVDGREVSTRGNTSYAVEQGGMAVRYDSSGVVKSMRNLKSVKLTDVNAFTAVASGKDYAVSEEVQVYLCQDGKYYATTLSAVNGGAHTLTGWYDSFGCSAGGQIRVIIAQ